MHGERLGWMIVPASSPHHFLIALPNPSFLSVLFPLFLKAADALRHAATRSPIPALYHLDRSTFGAQQLSELLCLLRCRSRTVQSAGKMEYGSECRMRACQPDNPDILDPHAALAAIGAANRRSDALGASHVSNAQSEICAVALRTDHRRSWSQRGQLFS